MGFGFKDIFNFFSGSGGDKGGGFNLLDTFNIFSGSDKGGGFNLLDTFMDAGNGKGLDDWAMNHKTLVAAGSAVALSFADGEDGTFKSLVKMTADCLAIKDLLDGDASFVSKAWLGLRGVQVGSHLANLDGEASGLRKGFGMVSGLLTSIMGTSQLEGFFGGSHEQKQDLLENTENEVREEAKNGVLHENNKPWWKPWDGIIPGQIFGID